MWTFLQTKKCPFWLWTAVSFRTGQIIALAVGRRDLETARSLWRDIPVSYRRKQVYTDGYKVYASLIAWGRHWVCPKGSGQTNVVEGVNNALRQRVSYLVRKGSSFARSPLWLYRRLLWFVYHRNLTIAARLGKPI
jgi:IS1 family transposase